MSEAESTPAGDVVAGELFLLRDRLKLVDEIDRSTTEMVARLAAAVQSSAEARAQANLDIAATIERLERAVRERDARRRDAMTALQQEVTLAHARAVGLGVSLTGLEDELAALHARIGDSERAVDDAELAAETAPPAASAPAAPKLRPLPSAASITIEVERVPTAGAALSIQRFVSELPGVVAATTREYAGGLLRLEVRTRGAFDLAALHAWPGGRLDVDTQNDAGILLRVAD